LQPPHSRLADAYLVDWRKDLARRYAQKSFEPAWFSCNAGVFMGGYRAVPRWGPTGGATHPQPGRRSEI